jgi:acetyl esterase/lipase
MWAVPKGCDDGRTLLCMHGGGFVGGSIYTHRVANGQPASAAYVRRDTGVYEPFAIVVLTTTERGIGRIALFSNPRLFPRFA